MLDFIKSPFINKYQNFILKTRRRSNTPHGHLTNQIPLTMPHHESEETQDHVAGSITDQIAKNPSSNTESTASDHQLHDEKEEGETALYEHHKAHPGPVDPKDKSVFETKASPEELTKRAQELNKDN
jgi:hypothetical protein